MHLSRLWMVMLRMRRVLLLASFIAWPKPELMGARFVVCTLIKTTLVANLGQSKKESIG